MLGEIKGSSNVDVSDYQEDDITYVADFPAAQHCGFLSFLPILIFVFSLVLCVMAQSPSQQIIQSERISPKLLGVESYVSAVKPMNEFMQISFRFDEVLNKTLDFNGSVAVLCKKAGNIVHDLKGQINQTKLVASPINWSTPQIEVFRADKIDFDYISLSIFFDSEEKITEKITLIWESRDPTFILVFSITKIISASAFLILCLIFVIKNLGNSKSTTLQKLTVALLFFSIFMIDPLYVGKLFPHDVTIPKSAYFRDIYFGFFFFYTQAIFSFIGSENENPSVIRLSISIISGFLLGVVLLLIDALQPVVPAISIIGSIPAEKEEFNFVHAIVYGVYFICFIVSIVLAKKSLKQPDIDEQKNEEPHPHTDRMNYYLLSTIPFVILYPAFYALSIYLPLLKGTTIVLMFPVVLAVMFGLVMDRAHTSIDRLQTGYVQVGEDDADEDNPIGVEADPNSFVITAEPDSDEQEEA